MLSTVDSEMYENNKSQPSGLNEFYRPQPSSRESFINIITSCKKLSNFIVILIVFHFLKTQKKLVK